MPRIAFMPNPSSFSMFALWIAVAAVLPSVPLLGDDDPASASAPRLRPEAITAPAAGLHNVLRLTDRLYSGSEPEGDGALAELRRKGITAIVSVDGARPRLDLAKKHGLRYIHIPVGYDGISPAAGASLARLAQETHETVYIHCHHGRHRGPAAAAVLCIAAGTANHQSAQGILERAGTSRGYAGLWRDVARYQPPKNQILPELVEVAEVDSLTAAMSAADRHYDNLELLHHADWKQLANHPDVAATQEALLLQEAFHEAVRALEKDSAHIDPGKRKLLHKGMVEAEMQSASLREKLQAADFDAANNLLKQLRNGCKQCHTAHRD